LQTNGNDRLGSSIYTAYLEAIKSAQQKIWITQAYFSPDREFLHRLVNAAKRGVDVCVLVPGFTDSSLVLHASHSHYGYLLRAGVKIYERNSSILHAKTAVIDSVWSTVGSSNLDFRSFVHNDEINTVVFGHGFAEQLEGQFRADIKESKPITLQQWEKRPFKDRLNEFFSRIFQYWI
jgi:cardiolipin synthase